MCAVKLDNPTKNIHIRNTCILFAKVDPNKDIINARIDILTGIFRPILSNNTGDTNVPKKTPKKFTEPIKATQYLLQYISKYMIIDCPV
jgi:hypothetical protein